MRVQNHTNGRVLSQMGVFVPYSASKVNLSAFMYRTVSEGFLYSPHTPPPLPQNILQEKFL